MWLQLILVVAGVVMILFGANYLTEGAAALAARFKIPQLIIGLTVVAFGTSAPELTVSVLGSLQGNGGIAVGNVIGSNILNIFAILGIAAMITPLDVDKNSRLYDIPIAILASLILAVLLLDPVLDGRPSDITRAEALVLVLMGILFVLYNIFMAKRSIRMKKAEEQVAEESEAPLRQRSFFYIFLSIAVGLGLLVWGSNVFVDNAAAFAASLGVSETLIGLTLVSWGTSAPELATSVVAAIKKDSGIAVGNIIGSNIFNIFFVLGIAGTVHPLLGLSFTYLDLFVQLFGTLILLCFAIWIGKDKITRPEGAVLALIFAAYTALIIVREMGAVGVVF